MHDMNTTKLMITFRDIFERDKNFVSQFFSFNVVELDACLKHLEIQIKDNMYKRGIGNG